jgi:hypothetical protein
MRRPPPDTRLWRLAPAAVLTLATGVAEANVEPEASFANADVEAVAAALSRLCFDAGMGIEQPTAATIVCSAVIDPNETPPPDVTIVNVHGGHSTHRLRFTLVARGAGVSGWASSWIEIVEPGGTVLEQDVSSAAYLARIQRALDEVAASFADGAREQPRWADRYETEQDWRLDAHVQAVAYCDRRLPELDAERIEEQIRAVGLRPFGSTLRDRCEALYEHIYEWGLERGIAAPEAEDYLAYRTALPPEERSCPARIALIGGMCL